MRFLKLHLKKCFLKSHCYAVYYVSVSVCTYTFRLWFSHVLLLFIDMNTYIYIPGIPVRVRVLLFTDVSLNFRRQLFDAHRGQPLLQIIICDLCLLHGQHLLLQHCAGTREKVPVIIWIKRGFSDGRSLRAPRVQAIFGSSVHHNDRLYDAKERRAALGKQLLIIATDSTE